MNQLLRGDPIAKGVNKWFFRCPTCNDVTEFHELQDGFKCQRCGYIRPKRTSDVKEKQRAYGQRADVKEKQRAYGQRADVKEKQRAYGQRADVKEKHRAYMKAWFERRKACLEALPE